jgi:hypothetical protein
MNILFMRHMSVWENFKCGYCRLLANVSIVLCLIFTISSYDSHDFSNSIYILQTEGIVDIP